MPSILKSVLILVCFIIDHICGYYNYTVIVTGPFRKERDVLLKRDLTHFIWHHTSGQRSCNLDDKEDAAHFQS